MLRFVVFAILLYLLFQLIEHWLSMPKSESPPPPSSSGPKPADNPHEILGVSTQASAKDIKEAYRKKCRENHPDQVAHLSREIQQAAKDQMQKVNWAYQKLSRQ